MPAPLCDAFRGSPLAPVSVHLKSRPDQRRRLRSRRLRHPPRHHGRGFAVLFVMVQRAPKPQPGISADLQASLERTSPTNVTLVVATPRWRGLARRTYTPSRSTDGGRSTRSPKGCRATRPSRLGRVAPSAADEVTPDARVYVTVVTLVTNSVLYSAESAARAAVGGGIYPPLITVAWPCRRRTSPGGQQRPPGLANSRVVIGPRRQPQPGHGCVGGP